MLSLESERLRNTINKGLRLTAAIGLVLTTGCETLRNQIPPARSQNAEPVTSYDPQTETFYYNQLSIHKYKDSDLFYMQIIDKTKGTAFDPNGVLDYLAAQGCIPAEGTPNGGSGGLFSAFIKFKDPNCGPFKKTNP